MYFFYVNGSRSDALAGFMGRVRATRPARLVLPGCRILFWVSNSATLYIYIYIYSEKHCYCVRRWLHRSQPHDTLWDPSPSPDKGFHLCICLFGVTLW